MLRASARLANLSARYGTSFSSVRIPADDLVARSLYWHRARVAAEDARDWYHTDDPRFGYASDEAEDAKADQRKVIEAYKRLRALRMPAEPRIVTSCQFPPIPDRRWDWCAYYEGREEGDTGWGRTEAEAIDDLKNNYDAPAASRKLLAPFASVINGTEMEAV